MPVNPPEEGALRVATFNIKELSLQMLANVNEEGHGRDPQVIAAARIIQRVRPDVLVILEIDHDMATPGAALDRTARLLAGKLSHARRIPDRVQVFLRRALQHGAPFRSGPEQRWRHREALGRE
jgi:hypothetical protein